MLADASQKQNQTIISQIWNRLNSSIQAPMIILFVLLVLFSIYPPKKAWSVFSANSLE